MRSLTQTTLWTRLHGETIASRLAVVGLTLVALTAFLLGIDQYISPPSNSDLSGTFVANSDRSKVFLLIVDALNPEVVDSGRLAFVEPLLANGFRAEVEPCADRLTIPCLREAFTGETSFGLFGAFENLVAAESIESSNLFRDVREAGLSSAGIANSELDPFAGWLDRYERYPEDEVAATVSVLEQGYDLVVYHYVWFDEATHRTSRDTNEYAWALESLSDTVGQILQKLPPEYELVVVGDHGHDENGRHIQGLDVPTAFLSSGSLWGQRQLPERIPIASYRLLLGAKLGILPPPQYEGANLVDLLPSDSILGAAAQGMDFDGRREPGGLPVLPALLSLALCGLLLVQLPKRTPRTLVLGATAAGVALSSGALYPALVAHLHYNLTVPNFTTWLPGLVLLFAVVGLRSRKAYWIGVGLLALFWIAFPQSLYPYGFYLRIVMTVVATTIGFVLVRGQSRDRATTRTLGYDLLVLLALIGISQLLAPVSVVHFKIQRFMGLQFAPPITYLGFPIVWGLMAAIHAPRSRWGLRHGVTRLAWGMLAAIGATTAVLIDYPPWITAVLTVATGASFFLRRPAALYLLAAWLLPQLVGLIPAYGVGLSVALALLAVWARSYKPVEEWLPGRWLTAGTVAAVAYFATAYVSGLRPNGLDFKFAIEWLPHGTAERLWYIVGAALLVKVLLPAALIFFGVSALSLQRLRPQIQWLIGLRLAASALFAVGFLATVEELPRLRLLEICEDLIVWWFLLAVASLVPWLPVPERPSSLPAGEQPTEVPAA